MCVCVCVVYRGIVLCGVLWCVVYIGICGVCVVWYIGVCVCVCFNLYLHFPVAQLVEHGVSNAKIMGSIPGKARADKM